MQSFEGHRGGPWFYPVAIAVGFFPWSAFVAPLGVDLVRRWRTTSAEHAGLVFALCWIGVWVGLFSLARTKLPSYVTPSYPALALLTATLVVRWTNGGALVGRFLALLPLIVLGGSDRTPSVLPRDSGDQHPLSGYKGADIRVMGRSLVEVVLDRARDCGCFCPVYLAGPERV